MRSSIFVRRLFTVGVIVSGSVAQSGLRAPLQAQQEPVEIQGLVVTATPIPMALSALGTHVTLLDGAELRARGVVRLS
ncbi:MAG TPA: hypothetical protein VLA43_02125, partial [Longimicrobiales bacterium]|nr:hypothetical protein [Longimicrobiales bacterium]